MYVDINEEYFRGKWWDSCGDLKVEFNGHTIKRVLI